jgi:hypothetical protein
MDDILNVNIEENFISLEYERDSYPFEFLLGQTNLCYQILDEEQLGPNTYRVKIHEEI